MFAYTRASENKEADDVSMSQGAKLRVQRFLHSVTQDETTNKFYRQPKSKRIVFFEIKIKRISEINTSSETFRCRFHIYLTWLATRGECDRYDDLKVKTRYRPDWAPRVTWANAVNYHKSTGEEKANFKIRGKESRGLRKDVWRLNEKWLGFKPWEGRWNRTRYEFDVEFAEEMQC